MRKIVLFGILILAGLTLLFNEENLFHQGGSVSEKFDVLNKFQDWTKEFGKSYSGDEEFQYRFGVFQETLE